MLKMFYTWMLKVRELFHSMRKQILNVLPHEILYRASALFKKYWASLLKPVLIITLSGSVIYYIASFILKWRFNPIIVLIIFLIVFNLFIVLGAIYGENQKDVYFRDD